MRQWFFLRQTWIVLTIFISSVCFLIFETPWSWWSLLAGGGWLFLHRRRQIEWSESLKNDGEILLAPIDGEIVKIAPYFDEEEQKRYTEIRINTSHYRCWGLYLPYSAEMAYLKESEGKRFPRAELVNLTSEDIRSMGRTDLILKSPSGTTSHIRFIQSVNGRSPKIWMKSGDRGRGAACFGYYPFGGSLIVFVPETSDVLVVEKEKIKAGRNVLAVSRSIEESHGV